MISLKALQLAQKLANTAPRRVVETTAATNATSAAGSTANASASASNAADQPRQPRIEYQIPEALKGVPAFLFQCVPMEKLVRQQPFLEFPEWCAKPTNKQVHLDVRRAPDAFLPPAPVGPSNDNNSHQQVVNDNATLLVDGKEWPVVSSFDIAHFPFYIVGSSDLMCDFRIDHPSVSRAHVAVVHHKTGRVCVCDFNSSNGTFLNGRQIEKGVYVPVRENDRIQLGGSSRTLFLRLSREEAAAEAPVVPAVAVAAPAVVTVGAGSRRQRDDEDDDEKTTTAAPSKDQDAAATQQAPPAKKRYARKEASAVTLHHLLIKHKDVEQPVSKAPRNKGELVTRSAEDAEATATMVRNVLLFGSAQLSPAEQEAQRQSDDEDAPQTVADPETFFAAVRQHSECGTAKKNGLMQVIRKGDLAELPEFEAVALHLAPLEVSRVVKTMLGMHLLFRADTAPSE
jgi:pSer/pThr/pTyr-binding forkhead associated (FHA) protein